MDREILYTVHGPKTIFEMTSEEVREALQQTDVILVPVGAIEAHGPHLPLGTDTMEADETCRRTAVELANRGCPVVIAPAIPFGMSAFHMGFPGTITIKAETLIALIKEVCGSLYESGFRNFILIHGHDGNLGAMMTAAQSFVDETSEGVVCVLNWLAELVKEYPKFTDSKKGESHGGEGETSRILATHPELVNLAAGESYYLEPSDLRKIQSPEHIKTGGAVFYATRSYKDLTPVGSIGTPSLATKEKGEKGYEIIVRWLADIIERDFFVERDNT